MSDSDGYNGWKNYETWAVALWIDNSEGDYLWSREAAAECLVEAEPTTYSTLMDEARYALATVLKDQFEEANPLNDEPATVFTDLLNAALSDVDWHEIAGNFLDEITADALSND